jgi:hypothetical protein
MAAIYILDEPTLQGTVSRLANELSDGFRKIGYVVKRLNGAEVQSTRLFLDDLHSGQISLILSVGLYSSVTLQVSEFCTRQKIPYFYFGFDNPAVGWEGYNQLLDHFPDAIISFTSKQFTKLAPIAVRRDKSYCTLAQGVSDTYKFSTGAPTRVGLFVGNVPPHPNMQGVSPFPEFYDRLWESFPSSVSTALLSMQQQCLIDQHLSPYELIAPDTDFGDGFDYRRLMLELDYAMYFGARMNTVAALVKSHEAVICGSGWEYFQQSSGKCRFLGSIPNGEVQKLLSRACYLVNSMTHFYACSERILEAAMLGCPVISTSTEFLRDEFGDSIWYYDDADSLKAAIWNIKSGKGVYQRIQRAREIALARHTWSLRAIEIGKILESHGFDLGGSLSSS